MNREQAIEQASNLRKGKTVAVLTPAVGVVVEEAFWTHTTFDSISAAKRRMRELGRGVALKQGERLPKQKEVPNA